MSLFGFVKSIGKSLFGKDAEAAENIKKHIESNNPGVKDLEVKFDDGIVSLCGECESAEALQKTILMAGNVKGVEDVRVDDMKIIVAANTAATTDSNEPFQPIEVSEILAQDNVEYYIIQKGDSLSKIAKEFYGNAMDYPKLFEANKEVIEDPDLIYPGQKIRIPRD